MIEATIVSAVVATIALLVNTRTCLEKAMKDIVNYKNHNQRIPSVVAELFTVSNYVNFWCELWRINDTTPADFFIDIWGEDGCEIIVALLRAIQEQVIDCSSAIETAFRVKVIHNEHSYRGDSIGSRVKKPTSFAIGRGTKLKNIVYRFDAILKLLDRIWQDVDRLHELSSLRLKLVHRPHISVNNDEELEYWLDTHFTKFFFFTTAERTRSHSQALYQECVGKKLYNSSLSLTKLTKVPERGDGANETTPNIQYDLITQCNRSSTRFIIGVIDRNGPNLRCSRKRRLHGFLDTHEISDCGCRLLNCMRCFFLYPDNQKNRHRLFYDSVSYPSQDSFQKLHTLFMQPSDSSPYNLDGLVSVRERLELAYQVSVFMFIMLQTSWTSRICSCMIVFRYEEGRPHFRVQLEEPDLPAARRSLANHWCHTRLEASPMKRFGLLLYEIAIANLIEHAQLYRFANVVENDFNTEASDRSLTADILSLIKDEMSPEYARAVVWCITQNLGPIKDYASAANEFFSEVLEP